MSQITDMALEQLALNNMVRSLRAKVDHLKENNIRLTSLLIQADLLLESYGVGQLGSVRETIRDELSKQQPTPKQND